MNDPSWLAQDQSSRWHNTHQPAWNTEYNPAPDPGFAQSAAHLPFSSDQALAASLPVPSFAQPAPFNNNGAGIELQPYQLSPVQHQATEQIAPVYFAQQQPVPPALNNNSQAIVPTLRQPTQAPSSDVVIVAPKQLPPVVPPPTTVEMKKKGEEEEDGNAKKEDEPMVTFGEMFGYADKLDWILIFVGLVFSAVNGVSLPLFSLIFGELINLFGYGVGVTRDELSKKVLNVALWFVYVAIGTFVCSFGEVAMFKIAGQRQATRIRTAYLKACMRQEIGWYDVNKVGELTSHISGNVLLIQQGIDKAGSVAHHICTFLSGLVLGFVNGWQLALVILSVIPLLAACGAFVGVFSSKFTKQSQDAYAKAGSVVEESLHNIRVVNCFAWEKNQASRYDKLVDVARLIGTKSGAFGGLGFGLTYFFFFCSYALSFWYGGKLIADRTYNSKSKADWQAGDVVSVFFAVVIGGFALGQAQPGMTALQKGRGAAFKVFQIINRESQINPESKEGVINPTPLVGNIQLSNVTFRYPSRPEAQILTGLSLTVTRGQRVALVGESGCGKSTVVGLLLRFYDAESGTVTVDGLDIRNYNVSWLRKNIGLVSQEPVLFAMSIKDNIKFGRDSEVSDQEVEQASRIANAHNFISKLPQGYNTNVGNRGTQLSGGQKQRIAIARACVRNPSILLLDEATSALDNASEAIVGEALEKVMVGRTSILIAHRLTTIRKCDAIFSIQGGQVAEVGTFDELLARGGLFSMLAARQHMLPGQAFAADTAPKVDVEVVDAIPPQPEVAVSTVAALDPEGEKKEEEYVAPEQNVSMGRLLGLQARDWPWFLLGFLAAGANGVVYPMFSIIFSEVLAAFQSADTEVVKKKAADTALLFIALACGVFLAYFGQVSIFTLIGARLTQKLRVMSFDSILRKDGGWFDRPENAPGNIAARLSSEAALVQGMTSDRLGLLVQNLSTLIAGLLIAFLSGWKLALVVLCSIPLIVAAYAVQMAFDNGTMTKTNSELGDAGNLVSETVSSIRTIASLGLEERTKDRFTVAISVVDKQNIRAGIIAGIAFGFSQGVQFLVFFVTLYYGGYLVSQNEWSDSSIDCSADLSFYKSLDDCIDKKNLAYGFGQMLKVFFALFMAAVGIGESQQFAPDAKKAKKAVNSIFQLIDEPLLVDPFSPDGQPAPAGAGEVVFRDVCFSYPTRKEVTIFDKLNLTVPAGRITALVGESGGGKSSIMWLLQRLYLPDSGSIYLDGIETRMINIASLRQQFSLVGQEPTLFALSIKENIAVGKAGATDAEIERAARISNAHDFITKLPQGYDTFVGEKFTQLSGGQKQRVAIARAIIRNPKILLLDEATSALDSESERLVQEALDSVMTGRTTIVIAHRLSTIRNAHQIAVVRQGRVTESGTHDQLVRLGGFYTTLATGK